MLGTHLYKMEIDSYPFIERLFSVGGNLFGRRRQSMKDKLFEEKLLLKYNSEFWKWCGHVNKKPLVLLRIIHKFNAVCLRKAQIVFLHPKVMIFKTDLIFLKDPSIDLDLWSYKFLDPLEDLGSLILKFSDTPNDLWSCVKILKKDLSPSMDLSFI